MNVILALCLLALAPRTPWRHSVDARAAPTLATPHSSESWEFEESDDSLEDGLEQDSTRRNLAELLLPYLKRELSTERHPLNSKKGLAHQGSKERSGTWPNLKSRKKHVVEITPLRGKSRDGKPLAYILAPAKPDLRRAFAKRLGKHHDDHEHEDHDGHHPRTKTLKESTSEEDNSEEVTVKASLEETEEPSSSENISEETIIIDKTTLHEESKQPSSSDVASEEEGVVSDESTSFKEQKESNSSGESSRDGAINSDTSTSSEEPKESALNKDFSEEEIVKSDKSVSLAESENSVSEDNTDEASVKSDRSVSIEEANKSTSSNNDTEDNEKSDKTTSSIETEKSGSSNDVKEEEEEPVNSDKITSSEEFKHPISRAEDTKEDIVSLLETKEYSSNEGDVKEETSKSDKTSFDEPSETRSGEDVPVVKSVKLDSVENAVSIEDSITSKDSIDQTENRVHESFNDADGSSSGQKSDSKEPDQSSPTLTSNENEGSNDRSSVFFFDTLDSNVNISDVSGKSSFTDNSNDLDNDDKQQHDKNLVNPGDKQLEEKDWEPEHTEVKSAEDKFTSIANTQKSSKSLHKSYKRKHVSHTRNEQSYSKIEEEETYNDQEEHDEVEHSDKLDLIYHHNHRHHKENHEQHHKEHKNSDSAENLELSKVEVLKNSSFRSSHFNADKQAIAINYEDNSTSEESTNEVKNKPDEDNREPIKEKETNTTEINENQAEENLEGEDIKTEDESLIDKKFQENSRNVDLEQLKSEISTVTNIKEESESQKSVEKTVEEGISEILSPGNESKELSVESEGEKQKEIPNEQSKTGQQGEESKLEESKDEDNSKELERTGEYLTENSDTDTTDSDIKTGEPVETGKTEPVVEEGKSKSSVEEGKPSEPAADSTIGRQGDNEEEDKTENSSKESKIEAVENDIVDRVADEDTIVTERNRNTETKSSDCAKSAKNKIDKIKKLLEESSEEDAEIINSHPRLYSALSSSKFPHSGIIISPQDGVNNLWEPDSQNVIELVQSAPCQAREAANEHPHEHKSYRLSFLFNRK